MTITVENYANFDQKFEVINNIRIMSIKGIKDTFLQYFSPTRLQLGAIEKFGKILTSGLVQTYLVIQTMSHC